MYSVSDETKTAYKSDASHKEVVVRIPSANITLLNEDIIADSLELKEAIETSGNLSFQGCIASSFKIESFNLVDDTLIGQAIECDITADETTTIPLFRGYIAEVTNATHEEFTTTIRAYDALYIINNLDVTAWYNALSFPISMRNFRNSFFAYLGVTQVDDYLPNDGMTIQKTIEDKVIMGETIIKAICQINGRYGRIGRTGLFEYVHLVEGTEALYPREDLYPADDLYPAAENAIDNVSKAHYTEISFENYRVSPITKVQIVDKEGAIAATSGTGDNTFTVENNPLVWGIASGTLASIATNLYNTIQGLWYTPSEIKCVGLPYVECGDFVMMSARRSIVRAYVLERTLKGIQILEDSYSAEGDRYQPIYTPNVQTKTNANASAISSESSRAKSAELAEASTRQSQVNGLNVRCDNLQAKDAQIENLVATKASITDLNATNATVSNLSARVASIDSLVATKASISDLNASNARISNLEATRVTASQVSSIVNSSIRSYSGALYCSSVTVNGRTYRNARTINLFDSQGNYYGQCTALCT